ncbi:MAG: CPBP family intramembrane metalloprotease [Chloroflexi bacterium]|nr:CPBP family intramembrane metalloprotease [Chloroflexota bacterium]
MTEQINDKRWLTKLKNLLSNPFLYLLMIAYLGGAYALYLSGEMPNGKEPISIGERLSGFVLFSLLSGLMLVMTWKIPINQIKIMAPRREALATVGYFITWLILNLVLWPSVFGKSSLLSNGISFWLLLVIVPALFLWWRGYRLSDIGITREHLGGNIRATLLAGIVITVVLLALTPGGRYIRSGELPLPQLVRKLIISFGSAFLLAGFHEEFFFRAVLQTRLSRAMNSKLSGLFITTLIFSLYHLPFALYRGSVAPSFGYALASVFIDPVFGGLVVGVLWLRTRNLLAPVFIHSLIDAINLLPMLE